MNGQTQPIDPRQSAQNIALGIHAITDRFSAHEEAFAKRLKEGALELIEDTALYEVARTRDAAGTARLIHTLIERTDALRQLLSFVKHRGLARAVTVDNLDYEIGLLLQALHSEDARFEEHVSRAHPRGHILPAHPVSGLTAGSDSVSTDQPAQQKPATVHAEPSPFDPLLGPDETIASSAPRVVESQSLGGQVTSASATATAVKEKTEIALPMLSVIKEQPKPQVHPKLPEVSGGLTDRQRKILGLFDREKEAPLKRVLELLPMFSEKTLRNDLNELVARKKIIRIGKAPRSRYAVAA